jgi:hypothetical protein
MMSGEFVIDDPKHCPDDVLLDYNLNRSLSVCGRRINGTSCSVRLPRMLVQYFESVGAICFTN